MWDCISKNAISNVPLDHKTGVMWFPSPQNVTEGKQIIQNNEKHSVGYINLWVTLINDSYSVRMFLSSQSWRHRGQNCLSWFDLKELFTYSCLGIEVMVFPKLVSTSTLGLFWDPSQLWYLSPDYPRVLYPPGVGGVEGGNRINKHRTARSWDNVSSGKSSAPPPPSPCRWGTGAVASHCVKKIQEPFPEPRTR